MKKNAVCMLLVALQFGATAMALGQTYGTDGCSMNASGNCVRQPAAPAAARKTPSPAGAGGAPATSGSVSGASRADAIRNTANMLQQMMVTPAAHPGRDADAEAREQVQRANARAEAEAREAQQQKALELSRARAAAEAERQRQARDLDSRGQADNPAAAGKEQDAREAIRYAVEAERRAELAQRTLAKCNQRALLTMVPGDDPERASACRKEAAEVDKYRSYASRWRAEALKRPINDPAFIEQKRQDAERWRNEELRRNVKAERERQLTREAEEQKEQDEAAYRERHSLRNTVKTMVDSTAKGTKAFIEGVRSDVNRVRSCADDPFGESCTPAD